MMTTWKEYKKQNLNISPDEMNFIETLSYLEAIRIKKNITQTELGKKIGMTQPQIAKIENMDSIPTLETLRKYAAGLGLKVTLSVSPV